MERVADTAHYQSSTESRERGRNPQNESRQKTLIYLVGGYLE